MRLPTNRQLEAYHRVKVMRESYSQAGKKMGISKEAVRRLLLRLAAVVKKQNVRVDVYRLKQIICQK